MSMKYQWDLLASVPDLPPQVHKRDVTVFIGKMKKRVCTREDQAVLLQ